MTSANLRLSQTLPLKSYVDMYGYVGTLRDATPRREILKFLQGLNLTHSVKDMRRDFANGYLVAQICQRHFPQDFQLHAFENGLSMATRRNNWGEILRLIARRNIHIPSVLVEATITMQHGGALALCEYLYEVFTGRHLKPLPPDPIELQMLRGTMTHAANVDAADVLGLSLPAPTRSHKSGSHATTTRAAPAHVEAPTHMRARSQPAITVATAVTAAAPATAVLQPAAAAAAPVPAAQPTPKGGPSSVKIAVPPTEDAEPAPAPASAPATQAPTERATASTHRGASPGREAAGGRPASNRPGSSAHNALMGSRPVARGDFEIPVEVQFGQIKMANIENIADLRRAFA